MSTSIASILIAGDICPGDHYFTMGHGISKIIDRGAGLADILDAPLAALMKGCGAVVGNLEGVISEQSSQKDPWHRRVFRGGRAIAGQLSELGFTHMIVANNHIMQHGLDAADDTITALLHAGITPIGLRSSEEGWHCAPVLLQLDNGFTVCTLAYSDVPDPYCPNQSFYATTIDLKLAISDVDRACKLADHAIVFLHGGTEGLLNVTAGFRGLVKKLVDCGADAVVCCHTHTLLGSEILDGRPVFYGLGNFIFDMYWLPRYLRAGVCRIEFGQSEPDHSANILHSELINVRRSVFSGRIRIENSPRHTMSLTVSTRVDGFFFPFCDLICKLGYFICNLWRGDTVVKASFLFSKFRGTAP